MKNECAPTIEEVEMAEALLDDGDLTNNIAFGGMRAYRYLSDTRSNIFARENNPNILQRQAFQRILLLDKFVFEDTEKWYEYLISPEAKKPTNKIKAPFGRILEFIDRIK